MRCPSYITFFFFGLAVGFGFISYIRGNRISELRERCAVLEERVVALKEYIANRGELYSVQKCSTNGYSGTLVFKGGMIVDIQDLTTDTNKVWNFKGEE